MGLLSGQEPGYQMTEELAFDSLQEERIFSIAS
jgi:hypothetical protein